MPRTVSAYVQALIDQTGTRPVWFVRLNYAATRYYASTGHDLQAQGFTWIGNGVSIGDIDESRNDISTRVFLPNADGSITDLLESEGIGQTAYIYRSWADADDKVIYNPTDLLDVFFGVVSGAPSIGPVAELELVGNNSARKYPFLRIAPPANNFNWPVNNPIVFNRKEIQVVE